MTFANKMTERPHRIAVFASGNGSNAENLIRYFRDTPDSLGEVALVVCNRPGAKVIERAIGLGVRTEVLSRDSINDSSRMLPLLESEGIDTIVLAGFLLMVPSFLLEAYRSRVINIHPSLLPKFGGKGMYGRYVHEAVVAAGEKVTGITIHHVSEQCDGGEIISQTSVDVCPEDTPETVEAKVHALEKEYFARVVDREFCR